MGSDECDIAVGAGAEFRVIVTRLGVCWAGFKDVLEAVEFWVLLLLKMVAEVPLVPWRREILVEVEGLCVELPPDRIEPLTAAKVVAKMTVEIFCVRVVE